MKPGRVMQSLGTGRCAANRDTRRLLRLRNLEDPSVQCHLDCQSLILSYFDQLIFGILKKNLDRDRKGEKRATCISGVLMAPEDGIFQHDTLNICSHL